MSQQKMRKTIQEIFCMCVRDDNNEQRRTSSIRSIRSQPRSANYSMQSISYRAFDKNDFKKPEQLVHSQQKWITQQLGTEQHLQDSYEIIIEIEKEEEEKLEVRHLSYFSESEATPPIMGFSEETKTSQNDNKIKFQGGLLVKTGCQFFQIKVSSLSSSSSRHSQGPKRYPQMGNQERLLLNMFYEVQVADFNLQAKHEQLLIDSMIGEDFCKYLSRRAKSETILVAHDPTGSILLQQLFVCQKVYYLEEQKTFSQVIDKAVRKLNMDNKLIRIFKSDINLKLDTAIINLMHHHYTDVAAIFFEYFYLAHDIIMLLPPESKNEDLIHSIHKALRTSTEYVRHASVEIQNIYDSEVLVGKILFYGEVSDIDLSEELHYLYSCISPEMKKKYKYQILIRELRKKHNMLRIFELFKQADLFRNHSDEAFLAFLKLIDEQKLLGAYNLNKFFVRRKDTDTSSSTESENFEDRRVSNSRIVQYKVHSKSENIPRAIINYPKKSNFSANVLSNLQGSRYASEIKGSFSINRINQYPD